MNLAGLPIGILTIVTFLPLVGALVVAILPTSWTRPAALAFALAAWVASPRLSGGSRGDRRVSRGLVVFPGDRRERWRRSAARSR